MQYFPDFFDFGGMTRTGLVRAIGNAVPARAGYVVALPLLIAVLENDSEESKDGAGHFSDEVSAKATDAQDTMQFGAQETIK